MKFKPTGRVGSVVVELGPGDKAFPSPASLADATAPPAFNLKKILVAVDFSELARKAVHYGVAFAKQFGAQPILLHVIEPYPLVPEMDPVESESIREAKQDLDKLRVEICQTIPCQTVLRTGEPQLEIISAANELEADLIILGTHGRSGLARVLLGGTAEKVVRHAGCPVLVVREHEHDFLPGNVLRHSGNSATKGH